MQVHHRENRRTGIHLNNSFNTNGRIQLNVFDNNNGADKNGQPRSQLLDDFRNSLMPHLQLIDLGKHVIEFAQDQHGSRYYKNIFF